MPAASFVVTTPVNAAFRPATATLLPHHLPIAVSPEMAPPWHGPRRKTSTTFSCKEISHASRYRSLCRRRHRCLCCRRREPRARRLLCDPLGQHRHLPDLEYRVAAATGALAVGLQGRQQAGPDLHRRSRRAGKDAAAALLHALSRSARDWEATFAPTGKSPDAGSTVLFPCPAPQQKYFGFSEAQIRGISWPVPRPPRGALRIVTPLGAGGDGRGRCRRRTALISADGEDVWS